MAMNELLDKAERDINKALKLNSRSLATYYFKVAIIGSRKNKLQEYIAYKTSSKTPIDKIYYAGITIFPGSYLLRAVYLKTLHQDGEAPINK